MNRWLICCVLVFLFIPITCFSAENLSADEKGLIELLDSYKSKMLDIAQKMMKANSDDTVRLGADEGRLITETGNFFNELLSMKKGTQAYQSLRGKLPNWNTDYLGIERALMMGRALIVQKVLRETLINFYNDNPEAIGTIYGEMDIGTWVNMQIKTLQFDKDIDLSSLSTDDHLNMRLRDMFKYELQKITRVRDDKIMINMDALITPHGKASSEVFIGEWGKTFAEMDLLARGKWKLILLKLDDGRLVTPDEAKRIRQQGGNIKVVDIVPKWMPGTQLFWWRAFMEGKDFDPPKVTIDTEPMLSLEMSRHLIADIERGNYSGIDKLVKIMKYVERSFLYNQKATAAYRGEWDPLSDNDYVLGEFAVELTKAKQAKNPALEMAKVLDKYKDKLNLEGLTSGDKGASDKAINDLLKRSKQAIGKNSEVALALRLRQIASIKDEGKRNQELDRMLQQMNEQLETYRHHVGDYPEGRIKDIIWLSKKLREGDKWSADVVKQTMDDLIEALRQENYQIDKGIIEYIFSPDDARQLRIYLRETMKWTEQQINKFIEDLRKKYPSLAKGYDRLKEDYKNIGKELPTFAKIHKKIVEFNEDWSQTIEGSKVLQSLDYADNALAIYDAYMAEETHAKGAFKAAGAIVKIKVMGALPSLSVAEGIIQAYQEGDTGPAIKSFAFYYFPTVGAFWGLGEKLQRLDVFVRDQEFLSYLDKMRNRIEFDPKTGHIIGIKTGKYSDVFEFKYSQNQEERANNFADFFIKGDNLLTPDQLPEFRFWMTLIPRASERYGYGSDFVKKGDESLQGAGETWAGGKLGLGGMDVSGKRAKYARLKKYFSNNEELLTAVLILENKNNAPGFTDLAGPKLAQKREEMLQRLETNIERAMWKSLFYLLEASAAPPKDLEKLIKELEKLEFDLNLSGPDLSDIRGRNNGLMDAIKKEVKEQISKDYYGKFVYERYYKTYSQIKRIQSQIIQLWTEKYGIDWQKMISPPLKMIIGGSRDSAPRLTLNLEADLEKAQRALSAHIARGRNIDADLYDALGHTPKTDEETGHRRNLAQLGFEIEHLLDDCRERVIDTCEPEIIQAITERSKQYREYLKNLRKAACVYEYSDWGQCDEKTKRQTRKVTSKSPANCDEKEKPLLEHTCTPATKEPATCTYTFSDWSVCNAASKKQFRKVISKSPDNCIEKEKPILEQGCISKTDEKTDKEKADKDNADAENLSFAGKAPDIWEGGNYGKGRERGFRMKRKRAAAASSSCTQVSQHPPYVVSEIWGKIDPSFAPRTEKEILSELNGQAETAKKWGKTAPIRPIAIGDFKGYFIDTSVEFNRGGWGDAGYLPDGVSVEGSRGYLIKGEQRIELGYSVSGRGCWDNTDRAFLEAQAHAAQDEAKAILAGLQLVVNGSMAKTPYNGPKLDGSDMPKVTLSPPSLEKLKIGDTVNVQAVVENAKPEDSPFSYNWGGTFDGKPEDVKTKASVKIKPSKPGKYNLSVSVDGARFNLGSASLQYEVAEYKVKLERVPPENKPVPVGGNVKFKATVTVDGKETTGNLIFRWQPNTEVDFSNNEVTPDTKSPRNETVATFTKTGRPKIFVEILEPRGEKTSSTVAVSNQIEIEVIQPKLKLTANNNSPKVGDTVVVTVHEDPKMGDDVIRFWWEYSGNAVNPGPVPNIPNSRAYSFKPRDTKPVTVTVHAKAKDGGDDLGQEKIAITATSYTVTVSEPRYLGPKPRIWKCDTQLGGACPGLVEVGDTQFAVFRDIFMKATVTPSPDSPRYNWTVSPAGSCGFPGSGSEIRINCSSTGTYTVRVEVTNSDGAKLGEATQAVTISISQEQIDGGKKAKDATEKLQEAKKLAQQGKIDEAIKIAEEAATIDPNAARPLLNELSATSKKAGWDSVYNRDFKDAVKRLDDAVRLNPADDDARHKLEQAKRFAGIWPQVEAKAREFESLIGEKKVFSAEKKMLEIQQLQHEMTGGMANPLSQKVTDEFHKAMQEYNQFSQESTRRHNEYFKSENWEAMLRNAQDMTKRELSPAGEQEAQSRMQFARQKLAEQKQRRELADRLWNEGIGLYNEQRSMEALGKFKESLRHYAAPDRQKYVQDLEAKLNRNRVMAQQLRTEGEALQNQNRLEDAVGKYKESLKYQPDLRLEERIRALETRIAEIKNNKAISVITKNKRINELMSYISDVARDQNARTDLIETTIKNVDEVLSLQPNNADAQRYRAMLEARLKERGAKSAASTLIKQGQDYYEKSKYTEAVDAFTRAIEANPNSAEAYAGRGLSKHGLRDDDGAMADINRALGLDPKNGDAYRGRSMIKRGQKDFNGGFADANRAVELTPNNYRAYLTRGLAREGLKDLAGALSDYNRAISLDPSYAMSYFYRARVRYDSKDYAGAVADYNRYIAMNANNSAAFNNRGMAKERLGDTKGAIADYERAVSLNSNNTVAKQNYDRLKAKLGAVSTGTPTKTPGWPTTASGYPQIAGDWIEVSGYPSNGTPITITQSGATIVAVGRYAIGATTIAWKIDGTLTRDGVITGRLVHTEGVSPGSPAFAQDRQMTLTSDGNTLHISASFAGGGGAHQLSWRRERRQ
jgi:tetratricopeptide (TPR) repeat protein